MAPKVRVVLTGHGRGEVFVDGVKMQGVHTLTLICAAKEPAANEIVLHLHAAEVEIEGPINVTTIQSHASEYRPEKPPDPKWWQWVLWAIAGPKDTGAK